MLKFEPGPLCWQTHPSEAPPCRLPLTLRRQERAFQWWVSPLVSPPLCRPLVLSPLCPLPFQGFLIQLLAQARATRGRPSSSAWGLTHASQDGVRQRLSTALLRAEMTSLRRLAISYDSGLRGDAPTGTRLRGRAETTPWAWRSCGVFTPCGSCCLILCICTCSQTSYHY